MSEELKPCPFCGNEPAPYWKGVGCVTSGCLLNGLHLDADKWNRRAQPAEAEGVQPWRERIIAAHPKSEPGYWPDELLVAYMQPEIEELRAALSAVTAERDRLREAAGKAIAWLDAEQNESGVGINRRIKLCRDAENSLRAAMAAKEA